MKKGCQKENHHKPDYDLHDVQRVRGGFCYLGKRHSGLKF